MTLTREDIAKYPFLTYAAEEVRRVNLEIQNLDNPEVESIVKRAAERIREALENNPPRVSYREREEDIEIPSFPVAIIMAAASGNNYIKRRYALGEAIRAYNLLIEEERDKILEVAEAFNWRIRRVKDTIGDRRFDFAISFIDYLRNTRPFHEDRFKLVNKPLLKGEVYLADAKDIRKFVYSGLPGVDTCVKRRYEVICHYPIELCQNITPQLGLTKFTQVMGYAGPTNYS